ncbi:hypothetical protein [Nonomuraea typhae]|uniref:hypothetical protein n=1 Tax=Nonomuraea typhae TaxID=2603600 RepID=UPI0012F838E6|nr:hypothetical protein [Nonomuraea typhae]
MSRLLAPGWPERLLEHLAVVLLALAAVVLEFALAESATLSGRGRAVRRRWRRAASEVTTVERHRDGRTVVRTATQQIALRLLRDAMGELA